MEESDEDARLSAQQLCEHGRKLQEKMREKSDTQASVPQFLLSRSVFATWTRPLRPGTTGSQTARMRTKRVRTRMTKSPIKMVHRTNLCAWLWSQRCSHRERTVMHADVFQEKPTAFTPGDPWVCFHGGTSRTKEMRKIICCSVVARTGRTTARAWELDGKMTVQHGNKTTKKYVGNVTGMLIMAVPVMEVTKRRRTSSGHDAVKVIMADAGNGRPWREHSRPTDHDLRDDNYEKLVMTMQFGVTVVVEQCGGTSMRTTQPRGKEEEKFYSSKKLSEIEASPEEKCHDDKE